MINGEDTSTHIDNTGIKLKPYKDSYLKFYLAIYQTTCMYMEDGGIKKIEMNYIGFHKLNQLI